MDMVTLINAMWKRHGAEVPPMVDVALRHTDAFVGRCLIATEQITTTSIEDCVLLYLLVRYFGRRNVFDVGTNIGRSALCMNEAAVRNGGVVTTCDPIDYDGLPRWTSVRFIRGPASVALQTLKEEGHPVDFCFFDWVPDPDTRDLLRRMLTPDAILATHDYEGANSKGRVIVDTLVEAGFCQGSEWFYPTSEPIMVDGRRINYCTAFCMPASLLSAGRPLLSEVSA